MALVELITEDVVKVPLVSLEKSGVVRELIQILKDANKIQETQPVIDAIMERESKGSTGLEKGIAVPHAKCTQVKALTVAVGISPEGIDFQALDGKPSQIFFLLLAPPDQSGPHIAALSEIAKITRSDAFMRTMKNSISPAEVVELFRE